MNILAMDASGAAVSTAVLSETSVFSEFFMNNGAKKHAETLMTLISAALDAAGASLNDMDYIACTSGPGSFTGLRIGAATAKGLAAGSNKKIIPVPALAALAYNIANDNAFIAPIMDARRDQVYAALFKRQNGELIQVLNDGAMSFRDFAESVSEHTSNPIFVGDGIMSFGENILSLGYAIAPQRFNAQRASSVGSLAITMIHHAISGAEFSPIYLRAPQAERNRLNGNGDPR
ncbi:MAG: tRNA (adenosine(37)-N6)-threonylcarbamoyltransferase complex dimerization subunit type 1 TsaB [Clostridiales bacterium]|jgi:tRNA threonylcarbamoyladenosine biosynthesis protein TsaB|nr:tRNA (adenosine(37)-N6)-threonylcarbamoyltransferase complex dimerization subunit type 1 TsaB [Clostridiales bacterium]